MHLDDEQHLDFLIMVAPDNLKYFATCPDALLLDCTFKTNKYNMPLLNLLGSNGNNRTIHLGIALMQKQDTEAFSWVFDNLKAKFDTMGITIRIFVTDNDGACINALNSTFNSPKIAMCRWHMNKDVLSYIRTVLNVDFGRRRQGRSWVDNDSTTEFMELYWTTLRSRTEAEFESNCASIRQLSPAAAAYLDRYWFNNHKEKLVDCWVNDRLHYGLLTTSKAEGGHRTIKQWLNTSSADVVWLFRRLKTLYSEGMEHLNFLDDQQNRTIRRDCQQPIFTSVVNRITRYALALTAKQLHYARADLRKRADPSHEPTRCRGQYSRSLGLPCWHRLAELELESQSLQPADFDVHWWVNRSQAARHELPPRALEPRVERQRRVETRRHVVGAGIRGNRRDPSLFERLDGNIATATAPTAALMPRRMTQTTAIPAKNITVWQATPASQPTPSRRQPQHQFARQSAAPARQLAISAAPGSQLAAATRQSTPIAAPIAQLAAPITHYQLPSPYTPRYPAQYTQYTQQSTQYTQQSTQYTQQPTPNWQSGFQYTPYPTPNHQTGVQYTQFPPPANNQLPPPANNTINSVNEVDDSFRFGVPSRRYGWAGGSNLYEG